VYLVNSTTLLWYNNLVLTRGFHTRRKSINRIGPQDQVVLGVITGTLLEDSYANKRHNQGTRICFRQSEIHKDYLFHLFHLFNERGYNFFFRIYTRAIKGIDSMY
jgi:hypothetical protein